MLSDDCSLFERMNILIIDYRESTRRFIPELIERVQILKDPYIIELRLRKHGRKRKQSTEISFSLCEKHWSLPSRVFVPLRSQAGQCPRRAK